MPTLWEPKSKVVITLTSMPNDVENLGEVLGSISNQTLLPHAIYVNLPKKNRRTGAPYVIPEWLREYPRVQILEPSTDYGPLTKLYPALEHETDPNTIIVSVDDDKVIPLFTAADCKVYSPHMLRHLVWHAESYPEAAWGICGWAFMWVPPPTGVVSVYVPWFMRNSHGRYVDVLQGVCGVAYRK